MNQETTKARPVTELRDLKKNQPVILQGNGPSRRRIQRPEIFCVGCNGAVYDKELPDVIAVNTYPLARVALELLGQGKELLLVAPLKGDYKFPADIEKAYAYLRAGNPNPVAGVFGGGLIGHTLIGLGILLGANPIILSGFDGSSEQMYAGENGYLGAPAQPAYARSEQLLMIAALETCHREVFVLYPHGNLPFPVWK